MDRKLLACVIEHGFQEAPQRSLILLRDMPVMHDNLGLFGTQASSNGSRPRKDEHHVHPQARDGDEIGRIRVSGPTFIASLRIPVHSARLGQILLFEVQPDPFLAQPIPDRSVRR